MKTKTEKKALLTCGKLRKGKDAGGGGGRRSVYFLLYKTLLVEGAEADAKGHEQTEGLVKVDVKVVALELAHHHHLLGLAVADFEDKVLLGGLLDVVAEIKRVRGTLLVPLWRPIADVHKVLGLVRVVVAKKPLSRWNILEFTAQKNK